LAQPWPEVPDAARPAAGQDEDYRFAAGLYGGLEQSADTERREDRLLLARALFGQGRDADARALLADPEDLPLDLALLLRLSDTERPLSDLERGQWRQRLDGSDGEALYWRARLELALDEPQEARQRLETLLRREAGSVFAPAALELLQSLPAAESLPAPAAAAPAAAGAPGVRLQWGVFRDPHRAQRQAAALAAYGQATEILRFRKDGDELYRVCSPPFGEEDEARATGALLKERFDLDFVVYRGEVSP
jgi:hypothetical protein